MNAVDLSDKQTEPVDLLADSTLEKRALNKPESLSGNVIAQIESEIGTKFTCISCLCEHLPDHSHDCIHAKSFTNYHNFDLQGHTNLLILPSQNAFQNLKHYYQCKKKAPATTSACIVVPKYYGRRYGFMKSMKLLKSYDCNVFCNAARMHAECRSDGMALIDIWHDKPAEMKVSSASDKSKALQSLLRGKLEKRDANFFLDTGATHNFVSTEFVRRHNFDVRKADALVHCAGNSESCSVSGMIRLRVCIQTLKAELDFYVIDLPPNLDACLGDYWLAKHEAHLSYKQQHVQLKKGKRWHTLDFERYEFLPSPPERANACLLSAMQVKKTLKKEQCMTFLVNVSQIEETGEKTEPHDLKMENSLRGFESVFDPLPPGLPPDRGVTHTIDTGNSPPVSRSMYRLSIKEKQEVEAQVKDLLDKGFIQPSRSPYGSPVLFVQKKDGGLRMCVDYRALNSVTRKDKYPLPRIDDLLDRMHGSKIFSSLDLQSGYHQIRIDPADVPKTAFRTHQGLFEFKVLSFGLTNAPAAFQREMNRLFADMPFVLVYLDDILIHSANEAEHKQHLRQVLQVLKLNKLYAKRSKCFFFMPSMKFLGHVISADGVSVDPAKIDVILSWPSPKDASEMRSFLGLGNHFKRFVQGYSKLTAPLVELTKPSKSFDYDRNVEAQTAFEHLKQCLTSAPVLALADVNLPFEVICDASGFGCGAVLQQRGRAVAYYSYRMNKHECNYSTGEQELLAVIKALTHWRYYLEGATKVTIMTDHMPNTFLSSKPAVQLTRRQVHWQEFLARFDFTWEYVKGKANVADPLSRNPAFLSTLCTVTGTLSPDDHEMIPKLKENANDLASQIRTGYDLDPWFQKPQNVANLSHENEIWTRGGLIVVPDANDLRKQIISLHHDTPFAGHFMKEKTVNLIRQSYWWPGMSRDVQNFVQSCDSCQRNKTSPMKPAGLLQPLPVPRFRWERVSVDLITHLPPTKQGHTAIVVFVDALSKMVHFAPAWDDMGSEEFAHLFLREVFRRHGLPRFIVSDRGSIFTSVFFTKVSELLGIKQCLSTAFHPQSDGQTERTNRTLEDMLRHFVSPTQDDWDLRLPCCEFAVNNAWNAATGNTPFFLNHGDHPRSPVSSDVYCNLPGAKSFEERVNEAIARARNCMAAAAERMKKNADEKRRELHFEVGDKVLLSTKNLKLALVGTPKMKAKFVGPFEILQRIGTVAYKLKLPESMSRLHPCFHVSLLKQYHDGGRVDLVPPPALTVDGELEYFIEKVVTHRDLPNNRSEYLVKWEGYGPEENSWLPKHEIENTVALENYLSQLADSEKPAARLTKSSDDQAVPTRYSQRLKKRRI